MNEFIAYLIAGLLIITAMMVIFNTSVFEPSRYAGTVIEGGTQTILNASVGDIPVGSTNTEIYSPYNFANVQSSFIDETNTYNLPDRRLANGLLFGSNEMLIDIKDISDVLEAYLSFSVIDTNKYGPIVVLVNNEQLASASYNIGQQKLYIPSDKLNKMNGDVTITVKPSSSGWFIWAPNVYDIKNASIVIKRLVKKPQQLTFALSDEQRSGYQRGWIVLTPGNVAGNMTVYLNDHELYHGPANANRVDYNVSILLASNMLTITPDKYGRFAGDANFLLFYKSARENIVTRSFNLTAARSGRIQFKVVSVIAQGGVNVKLNGQTICAGTNCYPTISAGAVLVFNFGNNASRARQNTFTISAVDNSAFTIRDLQVST